MSINFFENMKSILGVNRQASIKILRNMSQKRSLPVDVIELEMNSVLFEINKRYDRLFAKKLDKILVGKRTLEQHLIQGVENMEDVLGLFEQCEKRASKIVLIQTNMDEKRRNLRLSGIGRIG